MEYENIPRGIGTVISRGFATIHELDTVYGTEDLYDMLEILAVDAFNQRLLMKQK